MCEIRSWSRAKSEDKCQARSTFRLSNFVADLDSCLPVQRQAFSISCQRPNRIHSRRSSVFLFQVGICWLHDSFCPSRHHGHHRFRRHGRNSTFGQPLTDVINKVQSLINIMFPASRGRRCLWHSRSGCSAYFGQRTESQKKSRCDLLFSASNRI